MVSSESHKLSKMLSMHIVLLNANCIVLADKLPVSHHYYLQPHRQGSTQMMQGGSIMVDCSASRKTHAPPNRGGGVFPFVVIRKE